MGRSLLALEDVCAGYRESEVLHDVSLTLAADEVVCLIGRNGAGKTSIMRAIVQELVAVTAGRIRFGNADLVGLASDRIVRLGIALVPENRRIFPSLTVRENLLVPRPVRAPADGGWTTERIYDLFPQLAERRRNPAGVLSGGEQQMLSIARALLLNPTVLLLDEPHEGLAPVVADTVVETINMLKAQHVSMLVAEQAIHVVDACADRLYVVDRGRVAFTGTPAAFHADPEIARKYLMVM